MRDIDIRCALRAAVEAEHAGDPETLIVDELGLRQGAARVDIAVVNGVTAGYEIKSLADTLARLPAQAKIYSQVLDFVTIVLAERHRKEAVTLIPRWWGVMVATEGAGGAIQLSDSRRCRRNHSVNKRALVELLWHEETLELLRSVGADRGFKSKPRAAAWSRACELFSTEEIGAEVRRRLKDRTRLPAAQLRIQDGAACRSVSTPLPNQSQVCS